MRRILVIGAGAAGLAAATRARRVDPNASITVLEATGEYSRGTCSLPYYVSGELSDASRLVALPLEEFAARGIELTLRCPAVRIDPLARYVETPKGPYSYDRLIVAVGARARTPPTLLNFSNAPSLLRLTTIAEAVEARTRLEALPPGSRVAVIGGGYLGLEWLELLSRRGLKGVLFHNGPTLSRLEPEISRLVEATFLRAGSEIKLACRVEAIRREDDGIHLISGCLNGRETTHRVDAVAMATGVKPNCELLLEAGLRRLGPHGGVPVSSRGETELAGIFAAGDSVELPSPQGGPGRRWAPLATVAARTGRICGENSAGGMARLDTLAAPLAVRVFDLELGTSGFPEDWEASKKLLFSWGEAHHPFPQLRGGTGVLYIEPRRGKIQGGQLFGVGARALTDLLAFAIAKETTIDEFADLEGAFNPPLSTLWHPFYYAARTFKRSVAKQTNRLGYQST